MSYPKARLLLPFACLFPFFTICLLSSCKNGRIADQSAQKDVDEKTDTARDAPPAAYMPIGEAALRGFETGNEYIVSGKVTTELMEPLAGATVSAYGSAPHWMPPNFELPPPLNSQSCDDAGNFQIRLSLPANLWLAVKKDGYAPVISFLPVRDTKVAVRNYQLRQAAASMYGVVEDKKGLPIAGATIIANNPPVALLPDNVVLIPIGSVTDSTGKYEIEGLPDGDVSLVAVARGYSQQEEMSTLKPGANDPLGFTLPPATPIAIAIKNSRGEAIPAAVADAPGYIKIAGADKRGVIEFSIPPESGSFECAISADNYKSNTIQLDPKTPPDSVVLEDCPILKGRVTTESGEAVAGALVSVLGTGGAQGKFDGAAATDNAGRFELHLSYPPTLEVRVSRTGFMDQRISFDKGKPAPAEVAVHMKPVEAGIYGRVIDYRGIAVFRFVLHLRDSRPGGLNFQRSFSTGNGRYAVTDVTPGVYELVIQSVPDSPAEDVQLVRMAQVEIRKGFLFGEVLSQFPKPKFVK